MKIIKEITSWLIPVIIGVAIAFGIKTFFLAQVRVDGPSMQPNLVNNERIWLLKQSKIKHLSVIVFDAYGEDPSAKKDSNYVKRVIGLPGDTVAFKNHNLYVNNQKIDQSFISKAEATTGTGNTNWDLTTLARRYGWKTAGNVVPKGKYFVLGDHRSVSNDSRYWGYVKADKIAGVVKVPFWTGDKTQRTNINSLSFE